MGAIYSFAKQSWAIAAFADTAGMTSGKYQNIQGEVATRIIRISEVFVGGEASAAAIAAMVLARNSTVGATLSRSTGCTVAPLSPTVPASQALASIYDTATTAPQRAASLHLLELSMNAFGGIIRWVAAPGSEILQVGLSANIGDTSLSAFTGSGTPTVSSHILYEEL